MPLEFDPAVAVKALAKADKSLGKLMRRAGPFTMQPQELHAPFEALARSIVYQQLSGKAAATIYGRVQALFPRHRRLPPQGILEIDEQQLRSAGMSRAKTLAIKDLAAKTLSGEVPTLAKLKRMPDDEIIARLTAVRGIGVWTVEMLLMFRLGRPDVLPVGDLGVRRGFMLTYGGTELPPAKEMLAHAECWRPYRSIASWYLWRAVDLHRAATG